MYCENCGCSIPADAQFCPYCGKKQNPAIVYVEEKKSSPVQIVKDLAAKGENTIGQMTRNIASQPGLGKVKTSVGQEASIINVIASVLMVIVSFTSWIRLGGTSYSLLKLVTALDGGIGGLAYALFAYSDKGNALFVKAILFLMSAMGFVMLVMNVINIIVQLTGSKSGSSIQKAATSISSSAATVSIVFVSLIKVILMVQDYDFSSVVGYKAGPFLTWGIIFLSLILQGSAGKNKSSN